VQLQFAYDLCAYTAGLVLDVLVIAALLRNGYRRFPFVLIYLIVDLLTSVIEIPQTLSLKAVQTREALIFFMRVYYWNERIIHVLVFLIVIGMIAGTLGEGRRRRGALAILIGGTLLFAAITFAVHFDAKTPLVRWIVPWTRDLNFGAAILDMGLWAALMGRREKDIRILMVAAGLGIQFTGGAIGYAIRGMSNPGATAAGNVMYKIAGDLLYLTTLACLYIWWQAFRNPPKPPAATKHHPTVPAIQTPLPDTAPK